MVKKKNDCKETSIQGHLMTNKACGDDDKSCAAGKAFAFTEQ